VAKRTTGAPRYLYRGSEGHARQPNRLDRKRNDTNDPFPPPRLPV